MCADCTCGVQVPSISSRVASRTQCASRAATTSGRSPPPCHAPALPLMWNVTMDLWQALTAPAHSYHGCVFLLSCPPASAFHLLLAALEACCGAGMPACHILSPPWGMRRQRALEFEFEIEFAPRLKFRVVSSRLACRDATCEPSPC